jgi:prophage maintenance system killer protein
MKMENQVEIYQNIDNNIVVKVRFTDNSVWLNQKQLSELFDKDTDTIGLHLKNIYSEEELNEISTTEFSSVVQMEGKRMVQRTVKFYNLDAIISVGYRVNSKRGTQFRQWATKRLKDFLIEGIAINEKRLVQKNKEIQVLHDGIRILSRAIEEKALTSNGYEWLHRFSVGLQLLDDFDHEKLDSNGNHKENIAYPSLTEYSELVEQMRFGFHSNLFGKLKNGGFDSALHQIMQGFGDVEVYSSIEEKAAMLLYLIVKNHAFVDGNKRIAAACFLLFLDKNELLFSSTNQSVISNEALASLTLFVASSRAEEMETVKKLLISVLNRKGEY